MNLFLTFCSKKSYKQYLASIVSLQKIENQSRMLISIASILAIRKHEGATTNLVCNTSKTKS